MNIFLSKLLFNRGDQDVSFFDDVIAESKEFVRGEVMPLIAREPRLRVQPHEYTHAVKFPGSQRVDASQVLALVRKTLQREPEISLYAHIPVCRYRCTFCHYPVLVRHDLAEINMWVETVLQESKLYQQNIPEIRDCRVTSLYFGGGTPTVMSPSALRMLLTHFRESYQLADNAELTVEGSPDSCTLEKIECLRELRVNRVSLGVQTLDNSILELSNRGHSARQALECLKGLIASGIPKVNVDLMYGLPNQTIQRFAADLETVLSLSPTSVTIYRLRLNRADEFPTSMFKRYIAKPEMFPSVEETYTMQVVGRRILVRSGYFEEPSGWFSKPGNRVQVYVDRWIDQKPMIGFGWHTYSYSKWWEYYNQLDQSAYVSRVVASELPIEFGYAYNRQEQQKRFIALKLKSVFKLDEEEFRSTFGMNPVWDSMIRRLSNLGLLDKDSLRLTTVGEVLVEEIVERLLGEIVT